MSFIRHGERGLIPAARQADMSLLTSRVEVDVRQRFLHDPVQCQLDIPGQAGELRRHFQIDVYSGPLGIPIDEPR
jgi:hypothetical protein